MRHVVPALATLLAAAAFAAPALAHEGDPRYDSVLTGEPPRGIEVEILNYGDRLSLRNATGRMVVVEGYEKEPYARLLPDGSVQVNTRSPASYLNDDPYADAPVPDSADPKAAPVWRTVEGDGRFEFHDHRIHWMTPDAIPPAVKDESERTKVLDWAVPITIGTERTAITGTLWWRGSEGGMPMTAIAGFGGFLLASALLVLVVRRRRRRTDSAEAW